MIRVSVLAVGPFPMDGGAIFGVVPKSRWASLAPVDSENRIQLGLHPVLIRDGHHVMLVDAGTGESTDRLLAALGRHQVAPTDVTDVVFTHLHTDHTGGAFRTGEDGGIEPVFPNATYHVTETELTDALNPDDRTRHFFHTAAASWMSRTRRVETIRENTMLGDWVELEPAPGHTAGHMAIWVLGSDAWLMPGDLVPTTHHLNIHYLTSFDENARQMIRTKKALLDKASLRPTRVVFYHDWSCPSATVRKSGNRYHPDR